MSGARRSQPLPSHMARLCSRSPCSAVLLTGQAAAALPRRSMHLKLCFQNSSRF